MTIDDGQKRARKGGELGVNGEWYEGGKFIATTDARKSTPQPHEPTPAALAFAADNAAREARLQAWLESRRVALAGPIAALLSHGSPDDLYEGFYPSLGRQLRESGSLTPRQASFAAKGVVGRRTKANADQFDALFSLMSVEYADTF